MRSHRLVLLVALAAAGALAVILAATTMASDDGGPETQDASYLTATSCASCHPASYDGWNETGHARAWIDLEGNPNHTSPSCGGELCHTTGFGEPGGFVDNATTPDLVNVQCEECHGPGSDHVAAPPSEKRATIARNLTAELCGTCHQGEHHPFYNEWSLSGHSQSLISLRGALNANDSCLECHSADYILAPDPSLRPNIDTATEGITCAVCHDPHGSQHGRELRMPREDLCASCHNPGTSLPGEPIFHPQSSMRAGFSGVDVDTDQFMPTVDCEDCHMYAYPYNPGSIPPQVTGHSFRPKPEACASCHDGTTSFLLSVEESASLIEKWQDQTIELLYEAEYNIALAQVALERAPDYGFGNATIATAQEIFDEANYSKNFVAADGSSGAHNPDYTRNLLLFTKQKAQDVVSRLTPGTVVGRVVDSTGAGVGGIDIRSNGQVWTTTDSNGWFSFRFAQGTHSFGLFRGDEQVGSVGGVVVVANEEADVGTVTAHFAEETPVLYYVLILIVVIAAFIALYLLMKRRSSGGREE
jgi:predicted CXXCH cytochrome family protein